MKVIIIKTEDFKKDLEKHDWYYMMSDSPSVYEAGRAEQNRLLKLANQNDKLMELYNEAKNRLFKL